MCMWVCVGVDAREGKGGNRVRYVIHYKIRSCVAVIALII